MVNSFVAKKDLDTEMTVVRNEFEMRRERPRARSCTSACCRRRSCWHNYGKSTIGTRADIENVPIERLQAFYRKYYQPDNAVLVVAGKFDEAKALDAGQSASSARIPRPTAEARHDLHRRADAGRRAQRDAAPRRRRAARRRGYHVPPGTDPPTPRPSDVLEQILADTPSGRLLQGAGRNQEGDRRSAATHGAARSRRPDVRRRRSARTVARGRATRSSQTLDDAAGATPITEEEVERARATICSRTSSSLLNSADRVGLSSASGRRWATGGCSS